MTFHVQVAVTLRPVILDPQGKAVAQGLHSLGFDGVREARVGKLIDLVIEADSEDTARAQAEAACRQLLANPVMENYRITVEPGGAAEALATAVEAQSAEGTPR